MSRLRFKTFAFLTTLMVVAAGGITLALWGRRDPARALAVEGDTEAVRRMLTLALVP